MTDPKPNFEGQIMLGTPKKFIWTPKNEEKKSFLGLKKMKKMFFSKNPSSVIWLNIRGGQDSCPGDLDSVEPLGLIR